MLHIARHIGRDGWTVAMQSNVLHDFVPTPPPLPGVTLPAYGIALLFYRPERRLSVSLWTRRWSTNVRLWGPRLLSWQRNGK